jgi:hypothetical protein
MIKLPQSIALTAMTLTATTKICKPPRGYRAAPSEWPGFGNLVSYARQRGADRGAHFVGEIAVRDGALFLRYCGEGGANDPTAVSREVTLLLQLFALNVMLFRKRLSR